MERAEKNVKTMRIGIRFSRVLLFAVLLSLVRLPASHAQHGEPFTLFRDYIGLNEDQIKAIQSGKAVAKIIESPTPNEVFVFGSVYVPMGVSVHASIPSAGPDSGVEAHGSSTSSGQSLGDKLPTEPSRTRSEGETTTD